MRPTRTQSAAMAAIVLAGLSAAGAVWLSGRPAADADDGPRPAAAASAAPAASAHHDAVDGHADDAHDTEGDPPRRIRLTPAQQAAAGITTEAAGARPLRAVAAFPGEVGLDEDRTAHVVPRYAGVIESVPATLGMRVRRGQLLAVLASTELAAQRSAWLTATKRRELARSTYEREQRLWADRISAEQDYLQARNALQEADIAVLDAQQRLAAAGADTSAGHLNRFELRAPFDATVVEKHVTLGEAVKEDASVFTLSDLSTVWVMFAVPPQQLAAVQVGARVDVASTAFASRAGGSVSYVGPVLGERTRTATARVALPNRDGLWRPGLYVTVTVQGADATAALAVGADAVQTIDGRPTVFVADADGYSARGVTVGRSDGRTVEILAGLQAGERVAVGNSFVLKAELGKGAAGAHGHGH